MATTTKTKKAETVTTKMNANVTVERFSQVMQDGSINWNDEAEHLIETITKISGEILSNEISTDKEIQSTQLYYGYLLSQLATLEAQTTDKNGKFTKAKRISNNVFNALIVETFGETWAEKHKNNITAYRQVYEFTQAENFEMFVESGYATNVGLCAESKRNVKFFDTHEIDIVNFEDEKTSQYPSLKTLYSKYGFKINKDGQPEKRDPKVSNGANKRKEEKPTDKKANAEKAVQMVKGFLNALDLKPSDPNFKMEALTLFGNVLDNIALKEANKK